MLLISVMIIPQVLLAEKVEDRVDAGGAEGAQRLEEKREKCEGEDIPPILNPLYRHNKRHQFEFTPYGGAYLGGTVGQTWLAGSRQYFYLNNTVGLGANWSYSRLLTNRNSAFGSILRNTNMYVFNASVLVSNDASLRIGDKLFELDFYAMLGPGAMYINNRWEPMGELGGGVKIYTGIPWLAFKVDVGSYIHMTQQTGKNSFDFDIVMTGGVSFLFPTRPSLIDERNK